MKDRLGAYVAGEAIAYTIGRSELGIAVRPLPMLVVAEPQGATALIVHLDDIIGRLGTAVEQRAVWPPSCRLGIPRADEKDLRQHIGHAPTQRFGSRRIWVE